MQVFQLWNGWNNHDDILRGEIWTLRFVIKYSSIGYLAIYGVNSRATFLTLWIDQDKVSCLETCILNILLNI